MTVATPTCGTARWTAATCFERRLRVSHLQVCRRRRQEGRRVLHATRVRAADRRTAGAQGIDAHLRPHGRLQWNAGLRRSVRAGKAHNFIDPENIEKIVAGYSAFEDTDRFAHVADLAEIQAIDFNLNISRYVDTTEAVEVMSVADALAQLRVAEQRRDETTARMDALLAELGYSR